jgi:hypothetical protein
MENSTYQGSLVRGQETATHRTGDGKRGMHRDHSDTEHYDHFYKSKYFSFTNILVILTGDAGVGKSNFLLRYIQLSY